MSNVSDSAQRIADVLAPTAADPTAKWRWGTVSQANSDGTMDVTIANATVAVPAAAHVMGAHAGDRVRVMYSGTDAVVDAIAAGDTVRTPAGGSYSIVSGRGISGTGYKDYTFSFGPFDVAPASVVACLAGGSEAGEMGSISVGVLSWTESECTVRLWANGVTSSRNPTIRWIAL